MNGRRGIISAPYKPLTNTRGLSAWNLMLDLMTLSSPLRPGIVQPGLGPSVLRVAPAAKPIWRSAVFWVIVLLPALAASLPSWRADESLALRVTLPGDMRHTIWIKQFQGWPRRG